MGYAVLVLIVLIQRSHAYCKPGAINVTLLNEEQYGDDVWTDGTPSANINLRIQTSCPNEYQSRKSKFEIFLLRADETIANGSMIGFIRMFDDFSDCGTLGSRFQVSCRRYSYERNIIDVNATIFNLTSADDGKTFVMSRRWDTSIFRRQLRVKYCSIGAVPSHLKVHSASSTKYSYGEKLEVTCQANKFFWDGVTHYDSMHITCGDHADWILPLHICTPGTAVDFTRQRVTLISGKPAIFTCKSADSRARVKLQVGEKIVTHKGRAWMNITLTSHYDGITASCDEIANSGKVRGKRRTHLNVLYPPELSSDHNVTIFELLPNTPGHVVIDFRAHPAILLNDIQITKNGSSLSNYYMTVDGVDHRVVLDFLEVEESDYGDYFMTITSHPPVQSIFAYHFTIYNPQFTASIPSTTSVAAITGVALGAIFALCVIVIVVIVVAKKLCGRKNAESRRSDDVTNQAKDCFNYEDIDESNPSARTQNQSAPGSSYVNTKLQNSAAIPARRPNTAYEIPIPSRERNVPRQRVDESVYGYDN